MSFKWIQDKDDFETALDERLGFANGMGWVDADLVDDWYEFLLDYALSVGEIVGSIDNYVDNAVVNDFNAISFESIENAISSYIEDLRDEIGSVKDDDGEVEYLENRIKDLDDCLKLAEKGKIIELLDSETWNSEDIDVDGYSISDNNLMYVGEHCIFIKSY